MKRFRENFQGNVWDDTDKEKDNDISSDFFDKHDESDIITDQHKNFLTLCKQKINRSELPEHLEQWTAKKQYNYFLRNISKHFPNIPESLRFILPATLKDGDCGKSANRRPRWLDMGKFRRGQKFALRYFGTIFMSNLMAMLQIFSFSDGLKPLILSQKSNTPYRASRRYLSTLRRIRNWYTDDPWCEKSKAHRDIQTVRGLHRAMRRKLCGMNDGEIDRATQMPHAFCPVLGTIVKDFRDACPTARGLQNPYTINRMKGINQGDMSGTQFAFVGLMVLYPEQFGARDASLEDLEGFCHMWRGLGYLLGIEDQYNFCNGSLEDVQRRSRDFIEYFVKTNFCMVTSEWEHMSMCLFEGINYIMPLRLNYKIVLFWLCDLLELDMRRLYDSFCFLDKVSYSLLRFAFCYLTRLPGVLRSLNVLIHTYIDRAVKFECEVGMGDLDPI